MVTKWAVPTLFHAKKIGLLHAFADYQKLNAAPVWDSYSLYWSHKFIDFLKNIVCELEVTLEYWKTETDESGLDKIVLISPRGLCRFISIPVGPRYAPATFQREKHAIHASSHFRPGLNCPKHVVDIYESPLGGIRKLIRVFLLLFNASVTFKLENVNFFTMAMH